MKKSRYTEEKLLDVLKQIGAGRKAGASVLRL
jgi:hypothetical protein